MNALYTRAAARDYIDVGSMLAGDLYTREQLIQLSAAADAGFDVRYFEAMKHLALQYHHIPEVVEIAKLVALVVTVRTVDPTIQGQPHRRQGASGCLVPPGDWALTNPGLTVMGKRGGRYHEREVFIPGAGEVVIAVDLSQVDMLAVADLTPDVVREFDRSMRERFPRLVEWQDEVRAQASDGDLLDNGFGRKMRSDPARAHTLGPALMGQGAAREIMMEGLLNLPADVLPMLRAQVHDEIVLSVPGADGEGVKKVVVDALTFEWKGVPIVADAGPHGDSWGLVYAKG